MKSLQFKHESNQIVNQRYQIIDILGEGGIGITYQALNLETQQKVALKVVSLKQHKNWKTIELFEREAEVLKKLNHPGIPKYLDYFEIETEEDKIFYIAQELALGKSLDKWISQGWRTTEAEIKEIAKQILDILQYLHELKPPVIHRDIKPQNLIRNSDGKISLVDFGAVQNTYYNTLKSGSTVVGTYGYMAPEHFRAVPATDLYSLGATILYLLTHRNPSELPRDSYDNLKIDFRPHVNISEDLATWLEKMLQPAVEERFTSAKEALSALQNPYIEKIFAKNKRKALITLGLTGLAFLGVFHYKWFLLSRLGYNLERLCPQYYLKSHSVEYCLIGLTEEGNKEMVEVLLLSRANVNPQNEYDAPLAAAAKYGNKEIVELLLAHGARVNLPNHKDGKTALTIAVENGDKEMVELLKKHGATEYK